LIKIILKSIFHLKLYALTLKLFTLKENILKILIQNCWILKMYLLLKSPNYK